MSDLISRRVAIRAVNTALFPKINTAKDAEKALRDLPSAQPDLSEYSDKLWRKAYERGKRDALVEPQWIQCSERLPEMNRSILIANSQGWTAEGEYVGEYDGHRKWVQYRWSATLWDDEVLAWMPLPEPYKGEQNE